MNASEIRSYRFASSKSPPAGSGLSHLGEHRGEEGIVPPCAFDFAAYGRGARMRAESIECQLAQNGEVLRSVVLAVAGAVLVEDDVEDPVQLVLDTPVGAGDCALATTVSTAGSIEQLVAPRHRRPGAAARYVRAL